jgi:hypothetical protein
LIDKVASHLPVAFVRGVSASVRRKNFPLVHSGRCGSTVLLDLLSQNPAVCSDGEVLAQYDRRNAELPPFEYLQRRMYARVGRYYCFSTKTSRWDDLSPEKADMALADYIEGLIALGFDPFVVIRRRNLLAQSVSGIVARGKGSWHTTDRQESAFQVQVPIEGGADSLLVQGFRHLEEMHAELDRLLAGRDPLLLTYEDDVLPDPTIGYAKICDRVGIAKGSPVVHLQQTNPFALRDVIANFEEVRAALGGTPYAWMLE